MLHTQGLPDTRQALSEKQPRLCLDTESCLAGTSLSICWGPRVCPTFVSKWDQHLDRISSPTEPEKGTGGMCYSRITGKRTRWVRTQTLESPASFKPQLVLRKINFSTQFPQLKNRADNNNDGIITENCCED